MNEAPLTPDFIQHDWAPLASAELLDGFVVDGFWSAIFGAIIVSVTSTIASWYIGPSGRYEVFVVRRD